MRKYIKSVQKKISDIKLIVNKENSETQNVILKISI